ncbi:30S ribosomal protein S19 [Candidatus Woesebacteria bacterium]|nr:30S ribosomal protein S19 [Candidatus Woesebacteria bacterium]
MSRSSAKGPYVDQKLLAKVLAKVSAGVKAPIKTWARSCSIPPEFVGHTFMVHNGKVFKEVFVSEEMVGHKLGEFSPTRTFRGHGKIVKRTLTKT